MESDKNLLKRVGELGYPLLETEANEDPNAILADVIKSRDPRLWQGFPVMLANAGEKGSLNYDQLKTQLDSQKDINQSRQLLFMSFALYDYLGLSFTWAKRLLGQYSASTRKEYFLFLNRFKGGHDFRLGQYQMSAEKIKRIFQNYFGQTRLPLRNLLSGREELSLEYSLSQIFSPKQKDLVFKKLRREKLSKTEKEYFSRVVKKKILALANPELHRLAQRLIE
jgi:hypothetical protein